MIPVPVSVGCPWRPVSSLAKPRPKDFVTVLRHVAHATSDDVDVERQKIMGVPEREWSSTAKLTTSTTTVAIKG